MSICNHQICRECLFDNNSQNKMKCPICDRICKSTDIKKDALKESGIKILKAMLKHITCIDGSNILNFTIKLYEDVVRNHLGETPLHIASKRGNFMTLMVLLQSNINLDSKDNAGWTALVISLFILYLNLFFSIISSVLSLLFVFLLLLLQYSLLIMLFFVLRNSFYLY